MNLENVNPILLAFCAGIFTWLATAAGSAMVFLFKDIKKSVLNTMLGLAAGIMIAASFWGLLDPAIEQSEATSNMPWLFPVLGLLTGGAVLLAIDRLLPHIHMLTEHKEGMNASWQRSVLLALAITIHNLPEGFAVGVGFGALAQDNSPAVFHAALVLMIGMAIQNFPEGAAVSIPLRRENYTRFRSFMIGQFSGLVEPIGALIGAVSVYMVRSILPFVLSFAAGAMIYVVCDELIPESQMTEEGETSYATIGFMIGFAVMMVLDVALG